jgi:general secretion pathway protein B
MSYILNALRKADAERERDPARGIHAQPLAGAPAEERAARPLNAGWIAAGLAVVVVAAYTLWGGETPAPAVMPAVAPAPVLVPAAVVIPPAAPAVVTVATSVQPAPPPMPLPVPAPAAVVVKAAAQAPAAKPAASPAAVALAPPAAAPAPAEAASRVYAVAELPAEVQRELPKLTITGGVHSDNVAQRMLIVGGQVLNEGSEVAPGVVLEQIRAKTAVLRFRGYRYSVVY